MKVLVLCAGEGTRWGDFQGVPKHIAKLAGERLLDRTVRLVNEIRPDAQVHVVVADMKDERYKVKGSRRLKAKLTPEFKDADKFHSSLHAWAKNDRTVILYGDVWFSTDAMTQILNWDGEGWHAFHRIDGSAITGAPGGECFAFVVDPSAYSHAWEALQRIIDKRLSGEIWRNGGWEWYRALAGVPDSQLLDHQNYGNNTIINDFTEDMDTKTDWENWCWHYAQAEVKPE